MQAAAVLSNLTRLRLFLQTSESIDAAISVDMPQPEQQKARGMRGPTALHFLISNRFSPGQMQVIKPWTKRVSFLTLNISALTHTLLVFMMTFKSHLADPGHLKMRRPLSVQSDTRTVHPEQC